MKTIQQTYRISAPVAKVWQALTDAALMEQWEAGPATSDPVVGGSFSLWKGDIHGTYTRLVLNELIEQDWYGHDHPDRKYSVSFRLAHDGKDTIVQLTYSGDIQDEQKDIADWRDYYFEPIRKLLER